MVAASTYKLKITTLFAVKDKKKLNKRKYINVYFIKCLFYGIGTKL